MPGGVPNEYSGFLSNKDHMYAIILPAMIYIRCKWLVFVIVEKYVKFKC